MYNTHVSTWHCCVVKQGVKHLAYCPDHSLIVSGGFSYDLVINNQYVPNPVSRLQGHCSPIAGVEHVAGTSQVSMLPKAEDYATSSRPDKQQSNFVIE